MVSSWNKQETPCKCFQLKYDKMETMPEEEKKKKASFDLKSKLSMKS
jgi:hypothetical protein